MFCKIFFSDKFGFILETAFFTQVCLKVKKNSVGESLYNLALVVEGFVTLLMIVIETSGRLFPLLFEFYILI